MRQSLERYFNLSVFDSYFSLMSYFFSMMCSAMPEGVSKFEDLKLPFAATAWDLFGFKTRILASKSNLTIVTIINYSRHYSSSHILLFSSKVEM